MTSKNSPKGAPFCCATMCAQNDYHQKPRCSFHSFFFVEKSCTFLIHLDVIAICYEMKAYFVMKKITGIFGRAFIRKFIGGRESMVGQWKASRTRLNIRESSSSAINKRCVAQSKAVYFYHHIDTFMQR